jgi:hypothetical protein
MNFTRNSKKLNLQNFLISFELNENKAFSEIPKKKPTQIGSFETDGKTIPTFTNEFWTSKQRQASSLHEIAYRACFKAQLPRFFIELLTIPADTVYDPFSGRGTTIIEAALLERNIISNDINPLSKIFTYPRLNIPDLVKLENRLNEIQIDHSLSAKIDLSMFYHPQTETEILSFRNYLNKKRKIDAEDSLDWWIRMVATNRLTGHSSGFFSVYTLPPNQAVSQNSQKKINLKRNQKPDYRALKALILRKSKSLLRNLTVNQRENLKRSAPLSRFLTNNARATQEIERESVQLTVTSPPFLDVVQYASDNWLRCWFNNIDVNEVSSKITMTKSIDEWQSIMGEVFYELFRITRPGGWVAFEVGEVRNGKVKLEEHVVTLGLNAGFNCEALVVNQQTFTKTSNIWGVSNNRKGTNTNRIAVFRK